MSCAGPASPPNSSVCRESVKSGMKDYNEVFVKVTYECINESKIYKLCFKQEVMVEGQVYLASPLMFSLSENSLFNSCLCEITGVSKAEVLYADVDNSNLDITCGSWTRNEFLFQYPLVNNDLGFQNKPCTMRIIYRNDSKSDSFLKGRVWIKVSGSNMMLNCSGKSPDAVVGSTTTVLTALSTEDTLTMSTTVASSYDGAPSTTSSSKSSSPDFATISTGTETMTSTPAPKTSSSSFQTSTPVSKLLATSSNLITDIATVLWIVGLLDLVDYKITKVKLANWMRFVILLVSPAVFSGKH